MKIAFCHAGSDRFMRNADRTPPLDYWRPLWALGHEWVSVVHGERAKDLVDLPANVTDVSPSIVDLYDTRQILRAADVVITVDTSIANLAGWARLPAWVLLGAAPDWRWGLETCHWWPTLRLFRQPVLGDWQPVFDEVREALKQRSECAA